MPLILRARRCTLQLGGAALPVTSTVTTTCNDDGYNRRRVGGLWTGGGAPPRSIPRSIALKFSKFSDSF